MISLIKLYQPRVEELWFREKMLGDKETMSYNHAWGGTILFPKEKWDKWYSEWIANCDNNYFYRYIQDNEVFVGEVAYHFEKEHAIYIADVIVYAPYRGSGYGKKGLQLLCENAKENGIKEIYDNIAIDNPAAVLFERCGFVEEYRTAEYIMLKKVF